jgi:hypothetical protein
MSHPRNFLNHPMQIELVLTTMALDPVLVGKDMVIGVEMVSQNQLVLRPHPFPDFPVGQRLLVEKC